MSTPSRRTRALSLPTPSHAETYMTLFETHRQDSYSLQRGMGFQSNVTNIANITSPISLNHPLLVQRTHE